MDALSPELSVESKFIGRGSDTSKAMNCKKDAQAETLKKIGG
jgi:hypothetical protein